MAEIGAFVIDADTVGHTLLNQRPVLERVLAHFGNVVLAHPENEGDPPTIDRRALASIVFKNVEERKVLEAILHPAMRKTFEKAVDRTQRRGGCKALVLDAAILFEAEWDDLCDRIIFVDASRETRLARVIENRGWNEETLRTRELAQFSPDRKRAAADFTIANDGDLAALRSTIGGCWNDLLRAPSRGKSTHSARETATTTAAATAMDTAPAGEDSGG